MRRTDFSYELPEELIAHYPTPRRDASRLLVMGAGGSVEHRRFPELADYLQPGDLLVFNNTRVVPARLFAAKSTGGRVEILLERMLSETRVLAHMRASKPARPGSTVRLARDADSAPEGPELLVQGREGALFELLSATPWPEVLEQWGHVPLPPYIRRSDEAQDRERYQTVYAKEPGAVAAPTAGLHFTPDLLVSLEAAGIESAELTLHVGAGTFQPVKADTLEDHVMHKEFLRVDEAVCAKVAETKARGGRVVAVGTTSVRSLETAAAGGSLKPFSGDSDLFIYPGYRFRVVDAMLTNFHLPESTLLMLVSAFAGREFILSAYRQAVARGYRFFSYGDSMLLLPESRV